MTNMRKPADPQNVAPRVFIARRSRWRWASLAFMLAFAVLLLALFQPRNEPGSMTANVPAPTIELQSVPAPTHPASKAELISMSSLRGDGVSALEFLDSLAAKSNIPVTRAAEISSRLAGVWLSGYEGDEEVTPAEAADLFLYAGLEIARSESLDFRLVSSQERMWRILTAGAGMDEPGWGALRPWRALTVKADMKIGDLLEHGELDAARIDSAAWLLRGATREITIGDDGYVRESAFGPPAEIEIQALQTCLVAMNGSPDPRLRSAVASANGEILALEPLTQHAPDHPAVFQLGKLLRDADAEVASSAALALGNSAAVHSIELLVQRLDANASPATLAALCHAERLGRNLTAETMGAANYERRRKLFARVREWLAADAQPHDTPNSELYAAAWLRLAEAFGHDLEINSAAQAYCAALDRSSNQRARAIGAEYSGRKAPMPQPCHADASHLIEFAGPLWHRYEFTPAHAQALLSNGDRRCARAALWRLNRGSADWPADEARSSLSSRLEGISRGATSPSLRRLALEAAYRERPWRICESTQTVLDAFVADTDAAVQISAAHILGRLGCEWEIKKLAETGLTGRSPAATERLLKLLAQRAWINQNPDADAISAPLGALVDNMLQSADPAIVARGAWARMHQPDISLAMKVKLVKSLKIPAQRVLAVQGLATCRERKSLAPKMIAVLLDDEAPDVRAAVHAANFTASSKGP